MMAHNTEDGMMVGATHTLVCWVYLTILAGHSRGTHARSVIVLIGVFPSGKAL